MSDIVMYDSRCLGTIRYKIKKKCIEMREE